VDLDEVADELYAQPLERFTAVRTEREKQAKAAGNRELAASIHALAKPSTVAWLANQLARRCAEELGALLELGAELREATATLRGEQLRALTRQRHQVVYALVQQARALGTREGQRVTEDTARRLEQTLTAALADPQAAAQLRAGRLTEALEPSGFGGGDGAPAAAPTTPEPAAVTADERRRRRAEQASSDARRALDQARADRDRASRGVEQAQAAAEAADSELARIRSELRRAEQAVKAADRDVQRARDGLTRADDAVHKAEDAERNAAQRLAELS
jgi:hypothetical protein